jgi:protein-S-isoprenylcysteine O-methyltransferase Ste14
MDSPMTNRDASGKQSRLPVSVTSFGLNLIALGALLPALYILRDYGQHSGGNGHRLGAVDAMLILMGVVSVPVILVDVFVLRVHRRASTGLEWDKPNPPNLSRVVTKILGLLLTLSVFAFAYWVFPEYQGSFYDPLWSTLRRFWISLVIISITYVWFVDGLMKQPRDAYWQLGRLVLGRFSDLKGPDVANHFRGWLVKAFFFPLMFIWLSGSVNHLINQDLTGASWSNLVAYDYLYTLVFGVDLIFTTAGYALSMRAIDSHIRTAEPTMYGWVVALFCYQPFFSLFDRQYVAYGGSPEFGDLVSNILPRMYPNFHGWAAIRWTWAAAIIALLSIYSLATVAFGVRFSNLTHRGILTGGPYRFSKHPAYLTKNLSWWLISIPFLHSPPTTAIRHCVALACVNTIYFLRARTEERHLSRDPDYVAYALWMNEHGVLRSLGRWIPALAYKAPPEAQPASLPVAAE